VVQLLAPQLAQELPVPEIRDVSPLLSRDRATQADMIRRA
jgi:hypothetical protein